MDSSYRELEKRDRRIKVCFLTALQRNGGLQ
jgi:hypothetical protein